MKVAVVAAVIDTASMPPAVERVAPAPVAAEKSVLVITTSASVPPPPWIVSYNWECDDNDQEMTECKCRTVNRKGFIEIV